MINLYFPVLTRRGNNPLDFFITGLYLIYHRVLCKVGIDRIVEQFRHSTENEVGIVLKKRVTNNFCRVDLI